MIMICAFSSDVLGSGTEEVRIAGSDPETVSEKVIVLKQILPTTINGGSLQGLLDTKLH